MFPALNKGKSSENLHKQISPSVKPESQGSKKPNLMSPIGRRELEDLKTALEKKRELDKIIKELEDTREQIGDYKDKIRKLFEKSNIKETELKNYIANLNSKMYNYDVTYDSKIDEMHGNILEMISDIQLKVKKEILHTKKEMEEEVTNKFSNAEQKQAKLMFEKIEEQKKIFDKMSSVRNEIDKINKDFESVDAQCETLSKENESLRIIMKSLTEDNESLKNKLKMIIKENNNLKKEINKVFKEENDLVNEEENKIDDYKEEEDRERNEDNFLKSTTNYKLNVDAYATNYKFRRTNTTKTGNLKNKNDYYYNNSSNNVEDDKHNRENNERLIELLKSKIKNIMTESKKINLINSEEIKQRNESQQLLQKCIEDLKFDINKAQKDINNFRKLNSNKKNYESELNAKLSHLSNLENKFKLLSFIYDNGFQTNKLSKRNKLFE